MAACPGEALTSIGVRPVLALDRPRFGGLLISRITLAEGGGRVGLNVVDLKAAWRPSRPLGWGIAVSWTAQPARGIGLP